MADEAEEEGVEAEEEREPRGAAGFSLLFGALVSGVVEVSFTE